MDEVDKEPIQLDPKPSNITPFPKRHHSETKNYVEKRTSIATYQAVLPNMMTIEEAREQFEQIMNPDRPRLSAEQKAKLVDRQKLYLEQGFTMVEGKDLLGIWQAGRSPYPNRSLQGTRDMSQVEGTQYYHLNGPNGYFILTSLRRKGDGSIVLTEQLFRHSK